MSDVIYYYDIGTFLVVVLFSWHLVKLVGLPVSFRFCFEDLMAVSWLIVLELVLFWSWS